MRVLISPDSFKGTLSSEKVAEVIGKEIVRKHPNATVELLPLADGGEGSLDVFHKAVGGEIKTVNVHDALMRRVKARVLFYGEASAFIESAEIIGLTMIEENERNPLLASTYGLGEAILFALESGVKNITLALGGSATNDGGTGMAAALGVDFYDAEGYRFIPRGGTLGEIAYIDMGNLNAHVKEAKITIMCDVENTLCGAFGASAVYSPQKGATEEEALFMDKGMRNLAEKVKETVGEDFLSLKGGGAAGGLGFGATAFLGGKIQKGIEAVLNAIGFSERVKSADYVITGEGKLDRQSLMGKAVSGVVSRRGKAKAVVVCGITELNDEEIKEAGIYKVVETNPQKFAFSEVQSKAEKMLVDAIDNLVLD